MLGVPADEIPRPLFDRIEAAMEDVFADSEDPDWDPLRLSEALVTTWAVYKAQNLVDNENLDVFFENDWPGNPSYKLFSDAFRRIGAIEAADCIDDAVAMFPNGVPHTDYEMRRSFMESEKRKSGNERSLIEKLGERISAMGGDTMTRLAAYIGSHIECFPSVKRIVEPGALPNGEPRASVRKSKPPAGPLL